MEKLMQLNVNDKIRGFTVNAARPVEDLKGTLYEMTHEKTGAKLVWLKRRDENKTFCIGFRTVPEDDSGVFHICEHSVLNGSRKYPVREPFVDLLKSSMQTFLNAITYPDKTIYPVSSRNPKDFLNLMDVYLDAVLHPAIYTNPNIFYQEGWHYEIRRPEDEPVYKGVVLNEMKGAFSSVDEVLMNEINRVLYPDTCYRFVSGGDPEKITDLTYEQFLAAHTKFYHPSNSQTVLDGDLDIDAALEKIDSFFSEYEKEDLTFPLGHQAAVKPAVTAVPYEIGAEEEETEKTEIALAKILCDYDDIETQLAWSVLSVVLAGSNEAPLKKAILERKLGQDASVDVMDELSQPYLAVSVRNTDPEKGEAIRACIKDTVAELLAKGLRKEELKAILNQGEFRYRERKEPAGVYLSSNIYRSWLYGGDPIQYISFGNLYETLRQKADTDYFENLLREGLGDPSQLSMISAVPDRTLAEKRSQKEQEKLRAAKESWNEEIEEYIRKNAVLDEWQAAGDTPEQKATLPQLSLSDLKEMTEVTAPEVTELGGRPALVYPETDTGIVYLNLYFNLAGITKEHLPEAALLARLLMKLRTQQHSVPELQEMIRDRIGVLNFGTDAFTVNGDRTSCYPVLTAACSVLKQNVGDAVKIILEIMKDTVFEKDTILPLLQQAKEGYRQAFIGSGHAVAVMRAGSQGSAEAAAKEMFGGYEAFRYVSELADQYGDRYEEMIDTMYMMRDEIFTASRMTMSIAGEDNLPLLKPFVSELPAGSANACKVHIPLSEYGSEGIQVPAQISYAAIGNNLQKYDQGYSGVLRTIAQILNYGYLWNEVRVKGGSYGTGFTSSINGNIACWSYRDPSPENSLEVFRNAADYIEELADQNTDLTSFIIGTIAAFEPLVSPAAKILAADGRYFSGISAQMLAAIRQEILDTDNAALKAIAGRLREAISEGVCCVVGSAEAIDRCGIETVRTIS